MWRTPRVRYSGAQKSMKTIDNLKVGNYLSGSENMWQSAVIG